MLATLPAGFSEKTFMEAISKRPKEILSSNSKLHKDGIYNLSFPAYRAKINIGGTLQEVKTCPQAKDCVAYCYAQGGNFGFRDVRIKHHRNLQFMYSDPFEFVEQLVKEIKNKQKYVKNFRAIRIHDSADWTMQSFTIIRQVMLRCPDVQMYSYTKSVSLMKDMKAKGLIPDNFTYVFSYGGYEDHLIDKKNDRYAMAFPSRKMLRENKFTEAYHTDIPASNPKTQKVGLIAHGGHLAMNRIKKQILKVAQNNLGKVAKA